MGLKQRCPAARRRPATPATSCYFLLHLLHLLLPATPSLTLRKTNVPNVSEVLVQTFLHTLQKTCENVPYACFVPVPTLDRNTTRNQSQRNPSFSRQLSAASLREP